MATFEYGWIAMQRDCDGDIDHYSSVELMREMGDDGWELVCIYDNVAYFKRACPDYDSVEENVSRIDTNVGNNWCLLMEIKELLQTLVDNTMPVSGGSLGSLAQQAAKDTETDAPAPATDTEAMLCGFADEHVALALDGYEEEPKSIELFSIIVGLGGLLPSATEAEHHRHIVRAVYRYYREKENDDRVRVRFEETLICMAHYLSSAEALTILSEKANKALTLSESLEIFFDVVNAVLAYEKDGTAPFIVGEMAVSVGLFAQLVKIHPDFVDNEEMMNRVTAHIDHLREEYGIETEAE